MLNTHNLRIARKFKAFDLQRKFMKTFFMYTLTAVSMMGFWLVILLEVTK